MIAFADYTPVMHIWALSRSVVVLLLDNGGTMCRKLYFLALVTLCTLCLLTWPGKRVQAFPSGEESSIPVCGTGTLAGYIGTTCSQPPTVFHWISYSCTSTPASICERLGSNGDKLHVRLDPNGANTLLVGGTHLWDVTAGQSVDIVIRGSVYNANVNLTWPHFYPGQRAQSGDGTEENITTIECGENCISNNGVSSYLCTGESPDMNCADQPKIRPYFQSGVAKFQLTGPDSPYPFSVEIKLNGGSSGTATLRSLGLHICDFKRGIGCK
jgi:hypothetical protein